MDFSFVTARLATGGGIFTPDDLTKLVEADVTAIIDCRAEADDSALIAGSPYANRLQYLWNGVNDDGVHDQAKIDWLKQSLKFAMPLFGSCGAFVYAHCAAGVNRGPSTAYAILRAFGLSSTFAKTLIWEARPVSVPGIAYASDADRAVISAW